MLEVLDVTYNNLSESSLPANFFCLGRQFVSFLFERFGSVFDLLKS